MSHVRIRLPREFFLKIKEIFFLKGEIYNFLLICLSALATGREELTIKDVKNIVLTRTRGATG